MKLQAKDIATILESLGYRIHWIKQRKWDTLTFVIFSPSTMCKGNGFAKVKRKIEANTPFLTGWTSWTPLYQMDYPDQYSYKPSIYLYPNPNVSQDSLDDLLSTYEAQP